MKVVKQKTMHAETLLDIAMDHSESLIKRAKNDDQEAVGQLVKLWYKRMYNYAFKYFADHDLAMEVTQKTFISLHGQINKLKEVKKFKPWLYKVMVNHCREESRKRSKAHMRVVQVDEEIKEPAAYEREFNPDRKFEQKELANILQGALAEINEDQRSVVILKEFEGLKFHEIADALEISENTAKSRMYYGLNALKKILVRNNINKETIGYGI